MFMDKELDLKNNTKMANWTAVVLSELDDLLNEHYTEKKGYEINS